MLDGVAGGRFVVSGVGSVWGCVSWYRFAASGSTDASMRCWEGSNIDRSMFSGAECVVFSGSDGGVSA